MRKILAYILTLAIISGLLLVPAYASEKEVVYELSEAEKVLMGLGVVDKASYNPDALLTRAEFASVISELCNFVPDNRAYLNNMESSFGSDNKDQLITSTGDKIFEDVDSTMKEYEAINAMYAKGYMNGINSKLFGPYYDITASEVIKVLVSMLGRDYFARYEGGYPAGYMAVARKIKLTNGVALNATDFVTMRDALTLIYNAFDIKVYEFSGMDGEGGAEYTESEETFLNHCANIYTSEGNVTDNGITTYYGKSNVGEDKVVIGGVTMYIANADYVRGYLGRDVIAYYIKDDADKKYLLYAEEYEKNSVTFASEDFAGYTSSAIKYYNEDGKLVTASLSNVNVIYNNTVLDRYNKDTFDFLFGDITLVASKGGKKYDVVVVNDYMVGRIKKISTSDMKVYSETLYSSMNGIKTLDLSEEDGKIIVITDENGNKVDFDALSSGDVISVAKSADGSYINIKVCSAGISDFVISDYIADDEITVSDGTSEYTLKGASYLAESINIKLGESYDLYFDYEGNLIYLEALTDSTNLKKAILVDAAKDSNGFGDTCAVKLYTEEGELEIYDLEERVILNHVSKKSDKALDEIKAALGTVVLYRVDKETKTLKAMVTPLGFGEQDTDDRGWYAVIPHIRLSAEVGESKEDFDKYLKEDAIGNRFVYEKNGNMLDKSLRYDEKSTTLFAVPSTKEEYNDERKFYVNRMYFETSTGYYLNAYDTDADALAPEVIVFSPGGGDASGDKVSERKAFIISKIFTTLNADEEEAVAYKGFLMDADNSVVSETTFTVSEDAEFVDGLNKVGAPKVELEAGDIIRYGTNSDGDISAIFVAYDMSEGKAYPFGLSSLDWYGGDTYTGYVYNVDENYVRIVSEYPHLVPTDAKEQFEYFTTRANSVVQQLGNKTLVVEEGRNGVTVRLGSKEDIVSFKETGVLASDSYDKFVGIEYSWGHIMANVVYK